MCDDVFKLLISKSKETKNFNGEKWSPIYFIKDDYLRSKSLSQFAVESVNKKNIENDVLNEMFLMNENRNDKISDYDSNFENQLFCMNSDLAIMTQENSSNRKEYGTNYHETNNLIKLSNQIEANLKISQKLKFYETFFNQILKILIEEGKNKGI